MDETNRLIILKAINVLASAIDGLSRDNPADLPHRYAKVLVSLGDLSEAGIVDYEEFKEELGRLDSCTAKKIKGY